jgi:hypothetical protein
MIEFHDLVPQYTIFASSKQRKYQLRIALMGVTIRMSLEHPRSGGHKKHRATKHSVHLWKMRH